MIHMERRVSKLSKRIFYAILFILLFIPLHIFGYVYVGTKKDATLNSAHLKVRGERKYLGEFVKGKDDIVISGYLLIVENGEKIPLRQAKVYLYLNTSQSSYLLAENFTDENGKFYFRINVDESFPTGEVTFTVIYPGSISSGLAPTKLYYYAIIKEPQAMETSSAWAAIGVLLVMLMIGFILSMRSIYARKARVGEMPIWREILNSMLEQSRKRDINFVLLVRELVDSLCKMYGIIPKFGSPLQQKLLLLKDSISHTAFNILKNLVSMYELITYGGPYARTVLISTIDFEVWYKLLDMVSKELEGKK